MRHTMKMTLAALASLALLPTEVSAHTIKAPHPGTVVNISNGIVAIASGAGCNYWGVQTAVVGSVYWNVTLNSLSSVCSGNGGAGLNEAKHVWVDGWVFRIWNFNKTSNSYDRTCDRCQVGDEGAAGLAIGLSPRTRLLQDKAGTRDTSWYQGYITEGQTVSSSITIGVLD